MKADMRLLEVLLLGSAACIGACGTMDSSSTGVGGRAGTGGTAAIADRRVSAPVVFVIVMENHSWSSIKGNSKAPYINDLLAQGGHAEHYFTPPGLHPSEPNYLWLEAGDNFGINNDLPPQFNVQETMNHLVTQLEKAGFSWKAYQEDISGMDCPLTAVKNYAPKHNPMVFFRDVTDNNDAASASCISKVRPFSELDQDLAADKVANYNFLTPNLCHDMHDSCAPLNDPVRQGDEWLKDHVPRLLASKAYQDGAVVFLTWDEGDESAFLPASDGPIGMIVLAKSAKAGYSNQTSYTHSSTLRTVQEMFGLLPFLGDAANATDLADLFTVVPKVKP